LSTLSFSSSGAAESAVFCVATKDATALWHRSVARRNQGENLTTDLTTNGIAQEERGGDAVDEKPLKLGRSTP